MNERPRVLVVDDERGIVQLCQRLLEREGFHVFSALTPEAGLEFLQQQPINLLMVDIRMPVMDGFQVMKLARQRQPDLAVLMITGYGTIETAIEALHAGADGLTLKPFTAAELIQSVNRALEQNALKREMSRLQALQPLLNLTAELFSESTPTRLRRLVMENACKYLDYDAALLYEWPPSRKAQLNHTIERQTHFSVRSDEDKLNPAQPVSQIIPAFCEMVQLAAQNGQPLLQNITANSEASLPEGILSLMAAPTPLRITRMRKQNQIQVSGEAGSKLLILMVARTSAPRSGTGAQPSMQETKNGEDYGRRLPFTPADLELLVILSRQAAAALENSYLTSELRKYIRQLKESQHMLIQTEKLATTGRLMASIAHEINNPLQALQNCLHLARRSELNPANRQEYLEMAHKELNRLMKTVQRMLDFYRPAAVDRQQMDIHASLQNVLNLMDQKLRENQVKVITQLDPALPPVEAVAGQLQQVFLNLILNAIEAMPDGGILLITSSRAFDSSKSSSHNDGWIELTFRDNGKGVAENIRKRLFDPFTTTKVSGTGLGLSISYSIIAAHGGTLELVPSNAHSVDGSANVGACFRIRLPVSLSITEGSLKSAAPFLATGKASRRR